MSQLWENTVSYFSVAAIALFISTSIQIAIHSLCLRFPTKAQREEIADRRRIRNSQENILLLLELHLEFHLPKEHQQEYYQQKRIDSPAL